MQKLVFKNSKVYDILKFVAQIILPALGTLYFTIAQIWGLPLGTEIVGTIAAIDTFLGVILGISNANYKKLTKEEKQEIEGGDEKYYEEEQNL